MKDGASTREEQLSRYLDGDFAPAEAAAFEAVLASDAVLRDELRQWQIMRNRLRTAIAAQSVPHGLDAASLAGAAPRSRSPLAVFRTPLRAVLALAVCAVFAVGVWHLLPERVYTLADFPPAVAAMMEIGIGKHVSCVKERIGTGPSALGAFQSDVPAEYKAMLEGAQRALPADFKLVELHLCGTKDRSFAHLTLQRGNRYLSVLLTERRAGDSVPTDRSAAVASVGDISLFAVRTDGLDVGVFALPKQIAFVVSDSGVDENLSYTRNVAAAIR